MTEILRTERLLIRRAQADDLDALHKVMSHPKAMRYWSRPEHETIEETQAFLEFLMGCPANGGDDYVLIYKDQLIGKAGAWSPPEIGFILHPDAWGKGLAYEALHILIPVLFQRHRTGQLTADVDPRNAACLTLLAKLGFEETGRAKRTLKWRDEWCDSVYLALGRSQWDARDAN